MKPAASTSMKTSNLAALTLGLVTAFASAWSAVGQAADLPRVRVLATGGTIAGAQASSTDYGYKSGAYDVNTLINAVPNLGKLAQISGEQVANIGSQDMNDEVWLNVALLTPGAFSTDAPLTRQTWLLYLAGPAVSCRRAGEIGGEFHEFDRAVLRGWG